MLFQESEDEAQGNEKHCLAGRWQAQHGALLASRLELEPRLSTSDSGARG